MQPELVDDECGDASLVRTQSMNPVYLRPFLKIFYSVKLVNTPAQIIFCLIDLLLGLFVLFGTHMNI